MNVAPTRDRRSRWFRTAAVLVAACASVATFGGTGGWELHARETDTGPEALSAASATFSDVFRVDGGGIGRQRVLFDGAVEVTPSAALSTAAQVRVRFTPTVPAGLEVAETTVYVTGPTVFTAVGAEAPCEADEMSICRVEGTFEVTVLNAASLGATTLDVHWVATGSVEGRGPAAPADGKITLSQP